MVFFNNDFDVFIEALKCNITKKKNPENKPDVYNKKDNIMYIVYPLYY